MMQLRHVDSAVSLPDRLRCRDLRGTGTGAISPTFFERYGGVCISDSEIKNPCF